MRAAALLLSALLSVAFPAIPLAAAAAGEGNGDALVASLAEAGWRPSGEERRFTPENLYEEIDGEAELFLPYDFRSLRVAVFTSPAHPGAELRLEAYLHGGAKEAWGIFSQHRYEGEETVELKEGRAALSDASADLFRGACYVRLRVSRGALSRAALLDAVRAVDRSLPGRSLPPEGAALLLAAGSVPGTVIYQRRALSGYEALAPGFEGRLDGKGGVEGKVLLLEGAPEEVAKRLATLPGFRRIGGERPGATGRIGSPAGEKGGGARAEWRADLPPGTLYLRARTDGVAGVITRSPAAAAGALLDRLAELAPEAAEGPSGAAGGGRWLAP